MSGDTRQTSGDPTGPLLATALHDLRQPIQSALLLLPLLQQGGVRSDTGRPARLMELTLLGLQSMLDDLALVERLERREIERGGVSVPVAVLDAVKRELAGARGADTLEVRYDEAARQAAISPRLVRIVGLALASSALLESGGPTELSASIGADGKRVTLAVERPEPAHFPDELLERMFVELPLADESRAKRLYAPGLALAARIAHATGGALAPLPAHRPRRIEVAIGAP